MTFPKEIDFPPLIFDSNGELILTASPTSSRNDFDFLIGHHKVRHIKLKERLNNCAEWIEFGGTQEMNKLLTGIANVERHCMYAPDETPFEGMALRLFNPKTNLWSIYWADNIQGKLDTPVVGSFENNFGYFFTKDTFNCINILLGFKWDITDIENPVWSQAFSQDNGITWEWNWYMYFTKSKQVY